MKKRCKVCGAEYEMCCSCDEKRSWRMHTDTEEHFYIFGILMEYQVTHDAKQAYDALRKRGLDFNNTEGFLPNAQKLFTEICALAHKNSRAKKADIEITESKNNDSVKNEFVEREN